MSIELYLAYLVAVTVLVIIPGPVVTLVIGNSLTHGPRAGLMNVAGNQLGLAIILTALAIGLGSIIATMGWWFDWLRLAGAAYLIWLGWKLIRATGTLAAPGRTRTPRGGFFLQGLLVSLSNPKTLLFFGAFLPQFIDPHGNYPLQVALLGGTAMAVAAVCDSAYAVLTGRAGAMVSRRRVRLMSRLGGSCLIGGGIWLAATRTR